MAFVTSTPCAICLRYDSSWQQGESFRSKKKKDLLEQALWHCAIPRCAFSTFYEIRVII
jgi:hypothetical protein